jgi:hypothetical protein
MRKEGIAMVKLDILFRRLQACLQPSLLSSLTIGWQHVLWQGCVNIKVRDIYGCLNSKPLNAKNHGRGVFPSHLLKRVYQSSPWLQTIRNFNFTPTSIWL